MKSIMTNSLFGASQSHSTSIQWLGKSVICNVTFSFTVCSEEIGEHIFVFHNRFHARKWLFVHADLPEHSFNLNTENGLIMSKSMLQCILITDSCSSFIYFNFCIPLVRKNYHTMWGWRLVSRRTHVFVLWNINILQAEWQWIILFQAIHIRQHITRLSIIYCIISPYSLHSLISL